MERTSQRRIPLVLIAIALALVAARIASPVMKNRTVTAGSDSSAIQWKSLDEAARLAETTGKPLMFDFTAEWCAPCHQLDAEVFQNPLIAREINEKFIPVRVVDRQQEDGKNSPQVAELQQRFGVRGFPTVVFSDAGGSEQGRMEGFRGREEFERVMRRVGS